MNAPRAFGGLAIGVRLNLLKGVTFLKKTSSEYKWMCLCKNFFGFNNDVYVCLVYISLVGSSYTIGKLMELQMSLNSNLKQLLLKNKLSLPQKINSIQRKQDSVYSGLCKSRGSSEK